MLGFCKAGHARRMTTDEGLAAAMHHCTREKKHHVLCLLSMQSMRLLSYTGKRRGRQRKLSQLPVSVSYFCSLSGVGERQKEREITG